MRAWATDSAWPPHKKRASLLEYPGCHSHLPKEMNPKFSAYAHPEALVDGAWLQEHLTDPNIRVVESNEDVLLYDTGHIPGSVHIDWRGDLQDNTLRDYVSPERFAEVCAKNGIGPGTTVVFYGDKANWWAAYALWAFRLFGHTK